MAVDMLDVTHGSLPRVPSKLRIKRAGYTTGSPDIKWTSEDWSHNPDAVVHIDQSASTSPTSGNVKDVERGAATIVEAGIWAHSRARLGMRSTIYLSSSNLEEMEREIAKQPGLADFVSYWLANWNLSRAEAVNELGGRIVAIQYASPGSNPHTVIPGSNVTLAESNVDLSVTLNSWMPLPKPAKKRFHIPKPKRPTKPHPKVIGGTSGGALTAGVIALCQKVFKAHLTPTEGAAIATAVAAMVAYYVPSAPRIKP